jgi:2-keto-4-pentenoate hydratase/2-oxohepta-3-ene-1,7-dioic acid hydratase in catechol pathway
MKLLRCGNKGSEKPAALDKEGKIRDLSSSIRDFDPKNLNFETLSKLKKINLESLPEIPKSTRIGSCVNRPGKFVAIGLNYSDHAAETGAKSPSEPIVFMKATSCIVGPNDDVVIPKNSKKTDWEVEIAFVVGKETKYISEKDAPNHILGYCIVNDISEREFQIEKMGQWVKGKSADTFGPIGPYLVTSDEIPNVQKLNLSLNLNGQEMQRGNTNKMIFNINFILSYLSNFMSLQPGDIVTTGTPPGVGMGMNPKLFLKTGNKLKLNIEHLGEQNSTVIAE